MDRLFVAHKKSGESSNFCLKRIKRKYGVKKAGYSGTLDPFASGALVVAFGSYTKLFRFLEKSKKRYIATLWIGAKSPSLDIELIEEVKDVMPFHPSSIEIIFKNLIKKHIYTPPIYSAKKIDGKRAYKLAREGKNVELKSLEMEVFEAKIIHYNHPFLTFDVVVNEGAYVRSLGEMIAKKLGFDGALSSLTRVSEGDFRYENERALNPLEYISLPKNRYLKDEEDLLLGRVLKVKDFENQQDGIYLVLAQKFFSIVEIKNDSVIYHLNRIKQC